MHSNKVLLTAISALTLAAVPLLLRGNDSHVRIVRVSYVEGTVRINNQNVTLNAPLIEGNVLSTGQDSFAEAEFEDGSTMRLAPNTSVTFAQLARLSSGEALTRIDMNDGEAEFDVAPPSAGLFTVTAHEKNIRVEKSGRFRVLSTSTDPLELAVWKGDVIVHDTDSGQDVAVGKGETFTLAAEDPQQYDVENGVDRDGLDDFCELRDQELAQNYVSSGGGQPSASPVFLSSLGFLDPCGPYYWYGRLYSWYPGIPANCFNSFAFYYQPYPVVYLPGYPHYRHHPLHIHPPIVVAAAANVRRAGGAIPTKIGAMNSGRPSVRLFNDETFKRSAVVEEKTERPTDRRNQKTDMQNTGNNPGRDARAARGDHSDSRHVDSSRSFSSRQPSSSSSHSGSSHSSASAYSGARSFSGSSSGFSSHSSSGGFSGGGSASHSSSSSSSSSGSSGRSR